MPSDPQGQTGESQDGSVWAEVSVTVRTAEYESARIVLGMSRKVGSGKSRRDRAATELLSQCEEMVMEKALEVKEAWQQA